MFEGKHSSKVIQLVSDSLFFDWNECLLTISCKYASNPLKALFVFQFWCNTIFSIICSISRICRKKLVSVNLENISEIATICHLTIDLVVSYENDANTRIALN